MSTHASLGLDPAIAACSYISINSILINQAKLIWTVHNQNALL